MAEERLSLISIWLDSHGSRALKQLNSLLIANRIDMVGGGGESEPAAQGYTTRDLGVPSWPGPLPLLEGRGHEDEWELREESGPAPHPPSSSPSEFLPRRLEEGD